MKGLLVKKPHLNTTAHSGEVWANLRVEATTCVLMHVGNVKRDGPQALCAVELSRDAMALVDHGLQLLDLPPLEKGGKSDALEKLLLWKKQKVPVLWGKRSWPFVSQNKKKRKLQEKGSDPSVDDLGFHKMFASPKQLGKAACQAASPALAK